MFEFFFLLPGNNKLIQVPCVLCLNGLTIAKINFVMKPIQAC